MKILQIAVGIIRNPQNQIFITSALPTPIWRTSGSFQAVKSSQVKRRKRRWFGSFRKRWGLTPLGATLFDKLEYQFPDRHITLWFWLVENWEGEPWGKEGQPGNWVELQASDAEKFPPANEPVILRLVAQP